MKAKFQRSGGFAGLVTNIEVDTTTLSDELKAEFQTALNHILPLPELKPGEGADMQQYRLELDDGNEVHTLVADDQNATEAMLDLFDWLLKRG